MINVHKFNKALVIFILTLLLVLSLFACDGKSNDTSATIDSSDALDYSVPVKTNALLVVMTTDKTEYSIEDFVVLTFVANDKDAELNYGHNFSVEYWDTEVSEWKDCKKEYIVLEESISCIGGGTYKFKLSERIDVGYPKYRVKQHFNSNRFFADKTSGSTVYSNEFTVKAED